MLYSSGSVEDLGYTYEWLKEIRDKLHLNVLAYEYTGYGYHEGEDPFNSTSVVLIATLTVKLSLIQKGKPSEKNCYEDIFCAFKYLINTKKIPPERIILYGKCE